MSDDTEQLEEIRAELAELGKKERRYLGDGAYVEFDGFALELTTSNGIQTTNTIVLEPEVWLALTKYVAEIEAAAGKKARR